MSEIVFLTVEEILALHDDTIAFAGGAPGLRSLDLLESAIAQPEASFAGEWANAFPFGMASAYAFHLTGNHPFVDGNKRIGLSAAIAFLFMNGWEVVDPQESLYAVMMGVAEGTVEKPELATVFERLARRLP